MEHQHLSYINLSEYSVLYQKCQEFYDLLKNIAEINKSLNSKDKILIVFTDRDIKSFKVFHYLNNNFEFWCKIKSEKTIPFAADNLVPYEDKLFAVDSRNHLALEVNYRTEIAFRNTSISEPFETRRKDMLKLCKNAVPGQTLNFV